MSHIDSGPMANYNSLQDRHLVGYFNNSKMKRHLRKSGLVTRGGEIVTENTYRLKMARKEHQKHVRDMMAQAIVHKALDMERHRQSEIKRKLEEISKVELVRRVRSQRRTGDEDITPYLSPRAPDTRPKSAYTSPRRRRVQSSSTRPSTAPSNRSSKKSNGVVYLDDDGFPIHRESPKGSQAEQEEIDSHNLRELDSHILDRITLGLKAQDQHQSFSPYTVDQSQDAQPRPPPRAPGTARQSTARGRQTSGARRKVRGTEPKTNKRSLALHRKEPAYPHATQPQSMCDVTVRYRGSNLKLCYEREDKRDEIQVYQQHCGGENLVVFHGLVEPGTDIVFTSRRHHGFPFAATFYINRVEDLRLSTCCEYKYGPRCLLGGKKGHFMFIRADGATPCYRCAVEAELARRERQRYRGTQTQIPDPEPEPEPELKAQDTQTSPGDVPEKAAKEIATQADEDDYQDDFEEEDTKKDEKKKDPAAADRYSDQFSSEAEEEEQDKAKKEEDEEDKYKDDFFEQEPVAAAATNHASETEEEIEEETKTKDDVRKDEDKVDEEVHEEEKPKDEAKKDNVNNDSSSDSDNDNRVIPASSSSSSSSSSSDDSSSSDEENRNIVLTSELGSSDSEYERRRKDKGKKEEESKSMDVSGSKNDDEKSEDKSEEVSIKVEADGDTKSVQNEDDLIKKSVAEPEMLGGNYFAPDIERSSTPTPTRSIRVDSSSSESSNLSDAEKEESDKEEVKKDDVEQINDTIKDVPEDEHNESVEPLEEHQQRMSPDESKEQAEDGIEERKESVSEAGDSKKEVEDKLKDDSTAQDTTEGDGDKVDGSQEGRLSPFGGERPELLSTPLITIDKAESLASDDDDDSEDKDSKQEQQKEEDEVRKEQQEMLEEETGGDGEEDDKTSVKSEELKEEVEKTVEDVVSSEQANVEQSSTPIADDIKEESSSSESVKSAKEDETEENMEFDVEEAPASVSPSSNVDTNLVEETGALEQKDEKDQNNDEDEKKDGNDDNEKNEDEKDDEKNTEEGKDGEDVVEETSKSKVEQAEEPKVFQTKVEDRDDTDSRSDDANNNMEQTVEDTHDDANFESGAPADDTGNVEQEKVNEPVGDLQQEKQDTTNVEDDVTETKEDDTEDKQTKDHSDVSSVSSLSSESDSDGEQATSIKILNLQDRKLDSKKARKFARSLLKPKYADVGTLLLNDNPIGDVGITAITKSMRERAKRVDDDEDEEEEEETTKAEMKMTYLNLSNCKIGNKGVIELSELLKLGSVNIEKLDLSGNQIGSLGCLALAAAIRENNTLKTLNIADATLGPEGSKTLVEAIADNGTVEELNIEGNDIGEEGGDAILELVKDNSVIQRIKFEQGNHVSEKTTKEIREILDTGSFVLNGDEA